MPLENYALAQPQSNNETFGEKALRELQLAGVGLKAIPNAAVEAVSERPVETSLKLVAAAGLSAALGYASTRTGPLRYAARTLGVGMGISMIGDFGRNLSPTLGAFADNWHSADNWDANAQTIEKRFAPFVFDTALTIGGAAAGGYAGTALARPRPFQPTLPQFTDKGFLPPGVHQTSWQEFATRYGTTPRRQDMLINMEYLLQQARATGSEKVYVGGSFVTTKANPKDFDMTWLIDGKRIGELREINPLLVDRPLQQQKLGGELMATYPNSPNGGVLGFLQRNNRHRIEVGVVELDLSTLPSRVNYKLRSIFGSTEPRPITDSHS